MNEALEDFGQTYAPLKNRSQSFVGTYKGSAFSPTPILRKSQFSKMGYTDKLTDSPITARSKHLYNRAWYIENQKLMKGEKANHPLLDATNAMHERSQIGGIDIMGDVIHCADSAGPHNAPAVGAVQEMKRWEASFESFLSSYKLLQTDISTDLLAQAPLMDSDADLSILGDAVLESFEELNDATDFRSRGTVRAETANVATNSIFASVSRILRKDNTSPSNEPMQPVNARSSGELSRAVDSQIRRSFTEFHNTSELGFDNASAFLGDTLSVHQNMDSFLQEGSANFFMKTMKKSISLEHMSIGTRAITPCTIPMPGYSPGRSGSATPKLLNDVPSDAWFMPYIVAGLGSKFVDELLWMPSVFSERISPSYPGMPKSRFSQMIRSCWISLGEVWLSKDPSWRPWEKRRLFLCDNFLFECTLGWEDGDTARIIGFAPLCQASTTLIGGTECNEGLVDAQLKEELPAGPTPAVYAISVSVLKHSVNDRKRMGFWLHLDGNTLGAYDLLKRAIGMTADNVYRFKESFDGSLLGSGRFNVVVVGQRVKAASTTESSSSSNKGLAEELVEMDDLKGAESSLPGAQAEQEPQRALKIVSKSVFWSRVRAGKERPDALVREFLAQFQVNVEAAKVYGSNPDDIPVVQALGVFESIEGFVIEQELMHERDLFDLLVAHGVFSEEQTKQVVGQLLDAIDICNRIGIAHRDVKLSNVTFPANSGIKTVKGELALPAMLRIKLADFGMAGFCERPHSNHRDGSCTIPGRCGTPGYVAPDILNARIGECYSSNVDVFSIGVVAYTLLCGYEPFYGRDDKELIQANRNTEYAFHDPEWSSISDDAKRFIRQALLPTAEQRLKVGEAKAHRWLRSTYR